MSRLLLVLLLAACTQQAQVQHSDLVVDECDHTEFRQECELTVGHEDSGGTEQELQACYAKARMEALRMRGGVTPECMVPGAAARAW